MSRLTLAQQLAALAEPAPADLDPEDVQAGVDPEEQHAADNNAAREHYVNVAPSAIRKLHDSITDPKYDGMRTTRKQLLEDEDLDSGDDDDVDGAVPSPSEEENYSDVADENSEEDEEELLYKESDEEASPAPSPSPSDRPGGTRAIQSNQPVKDPEPDLASNLRKTREEDRQKGKAVSRQIALWDSLLDARIQMQKVVTAANRLPTGTYLSHLAQNGSARAALEGLFGEAAALSEDLFSLQEGLLRDNESIEPPPRKRRRVDLEQDPSYDYPDHLRDLSAAASALESSYHSHLIHTLAKWSAKVQAVAPSVLLGNKTAFNKDDRSKVGAVGMVDDLLRTDGTKLLARTRTRRSNTKRLESADHRDEPRGADDGNDDEKEDAELFDDLDFYQQLLRDVIKARTGDTGEQDWMAQQRERKARKKLKVDTKASKGRKLRYEVHTKLQNFMVPVPVTHGGWHDEQIDGLFSSLLGAG
ncbi:apoptosis-antagonizing transcription factor [Rhodofomes roseus]|uniref:Protein BFR2 n=1 Tax=Rhodofomes roseus TaxID=34475 RepID=A0ABQ8KP80_9APHY|nr:apoptosis-antagonizing transcription factor [Rhodofomes roseus]KAH9840131.1 apoptosis-antagonizing transcription factor [Rhodofomes roseus]